MSLRVRPPPQKKIGGGAAGHTFIAKNPNYATGLQTVMHISLKEVCRDKRTKVRLTRTGTAPKRSSNTN